MLSTFQVISWERIKMNLRCSPLQRLLFLDAVGRMRFEVIAVLFQRLDGGHVVISERIQNFQTEFDVWLSTPCQADGAMRGMFTLSVVAEAARATAAQRANGVADFRVLILATLQSLLRQFRFRAVRSEEHTSELQSRFGISY